MKILKITLIIGMIEIILLDYLQGDGAGASRRR